MRVCNAVRRIRSRCAARTTSNDAVQRAHDVGIGAGCRLERSATPRCACSTALALSKTAFKKESAARTLRLSGRRRATARRPLTVLDSPHSSLRIGRWSINGTGVREEYVSQGGARTYVISPSNFPRFLTTTFLTLKPPVVDSSNMVNISVIAPANGPSKVSAASCVARAVVDSACASCPRSGNRLAAASPMAFAARPSGHQAMFMRCG